MSDVRVPSSRPVRGAASGSSLTEKQWQSTVENYAKLKSWLHYHTRRSKGSEPGFPDLVLLRRDRLVVAELKTDAAPGPTPDQRKWLEAFALAGAEVHVWRPRDLQAVLHVLA